MRQHIRHALALLILAVALWPAALLAAEQGAVEPPSGAPGTRFVFLADGFQANERLSSWANTPDGRVLPFDADVPEQATSDGSVSWNWAAPADFAAGTWQFVVHGRSSGVERVFTLSINPPAEAPPSTAYNIQPAVGRPGDVFRFYATGFSAGEAVDTQVVAPDGAATTAGLRVNTGAQAGGRVDGSWTAPLDVQAYGAWRIALRGVDSGVERVIPFTIEPPPAQNLPAPQVSPAAGRPGMLFIFAVAGFQADEPLSAWVNTADGRIVAVDEPNLQAAGDGRASISWAAPADAAPGAWTMVIHGRRSGIEQVAAFTITT
jgi:hypothetical protein